MTIRLLTVTYPKAALRGSITRVVLALPCCDSTLSRLIYSLPISSSFSLSYAQHPGNAF